MDKKKKKTKFQDGDIWFNHMTRTPYIFRDGSWMAITENTLLSDVAIK